MSAVQAFSVRCLRGPNIWAREPVLQVTARCSEPDAGALARETLRLQIACGAKVSLARVVCGPEPGTYTIIVELEDEEVARRCLSAALESCPTSDDTVRQIREWADDIVLGPNTRALAEAARNRGIPVRRLGRGSLLILGQGARQRRLWGARSGRTSAIAEMIGWDKPLTKQLLSAVGLPVPEGRLVSNAADAVKAAAEIGGAVVVKPESANHGRAVFLDLAGPAEIRAAFESARAEGETGAVVVERCIAGAEHRVLVVGGRVVAAMRGDPLYASGDGRRPVRELVEEINMDPARGEGADNPLYPVQFDDVTSATIRRQGFTPESVPAPGERVLIQRNGNLRRDVTAAIHPANRAACVLAAETIGLDIAGIDLVVEDISAPLREQGGAIVEVNPMPGFTMHATVPVADLIVRELYPKQANGRIPIAAVHGASATILSNTIHALLRNRGVFAGVTCATGTMASVDFNASGSCSAESAAGLLLHPRLEAAVFEIREREAVGEGLPFDVCDVLALADSPSLTPGARLLIGCVAPGGAVFVPDAAAWRDEAARLCPCAFRTYAIGPDWETSLAHEVTKELVSRCGC